MSSPPYDYDPNNPYIFPDLQDEQRYSQEDAPKEPKVVWCVACNTIINGLELHILKTLYYGWHVKKECLQNMEDWIIEECKKRGTVKCKI